MIDRYLHQFSCWLLALERPTATRLTLAGTLLVALYSCTTITQHPPGTRENCLSLLCFLPEAVIFNPRLFVALKLVFFASAVLWFLQRILPWSSTIAALSFTVLVSLSHDTNYYTPHLYHFENLYLLICATWQLLYRAPIAESLRCGRFWNTPLVPNWVNFLFLYYISLAYSFSGASKIFYSGLGWANGLSLQLWVKFLAESRLDNPIVQLLVSERVIAFAAQLTTLIAEAFCWLALFSLRLRVLLGVLLLGFHLTSEFVFGLGFYGNILGIFSVMIVQPLLTSTRFAKPFAARSTSRAFAKAGQRSN